MKKIKVTICVGTTCFVMGASQLQTLEDHLYPEIKDFVEIDGARCLGLCRNENYCGAPYVLIDGEPMCEATIPKILERIEEILKNKKDSGETSAA